MVVVQINHQARQTDTPNTQCYPPEPLAQVRPNEPSSPALLQCTLKFSSYYYYYYYYYCYNNSRLSTRLQETFQQDILQSLRAPHYPLQDPSYQPRAIPNPGQSNHNPIHLWLFPSTVMHSCTIHAKKRTRQSHNFKTQSHTTSGGRYELCLPTLLGKLPCIFRIDHFSIQDWYNGALNCCLC